MPYITQARRDELSFSSDPAKANPQVAGELNYEITQVIISYMLGHGLNYQHINDVLGALEGCKLEFYNRVAVPYEKKKIKENGDVYPPELLSLPEKLPEVPGRPGLIV